MSAYFLYINPLYIKQILIALALLISGIYVIYYRRSVLLRMALDRYMFAQKTYSHLLSGLEIILTDKDPELNFNRLRTEYTNCVSFCDRRVAESVQTYLLALFEAVQKKKALNEESHRAFQAEIVNRIRSVQRLRTLQEPAMIRPVERKEKQLLIERKKDHPRLGGQVIQHVRFDYETYSMGVSNRLSHMKVPPEFVKGPFIK